MKNNYDVLVIGGGPGGAIAADTAAKSGLSVCLVEKRPSIGVQIRCAEGIGKELLKEFFLTPNPKWIDAEIEGANIVGPDGTKLFLSPQMAGNEVGYTLNRKIFDQDLVRQAADSGADIYVKARACGPIIENGILKGAKVEINGLIHDIYSRIAIAADGIESKFAKWCGIDTTVPIHELESGVQYLITNIDIEKNITSFYIGSNVAPEGYLWVFPKGDRIANVGIGISGKRNTNHQKSIDYLNSFVDRTFPNGKIIERAYGGVSSCLPLNCTVSDGLLIIGDAARVSDPLTGGGIYNSMYTGKIAAETAITCISHGDTSKNALMEYDQKWRESYMGITIKRNYAIKKIFLKQTDEMLNEIIHSAKKIDLEHFSTLNLIKEIVTRNPKLLLNLKGIQELVAI